MVRISQILEFQFFVLVFGWKACENNETLKKQRFGPPRPEKGSRKDQTFDNLCQYHTLLNSSDEKRELVLSVCAMKNFVRGQDCILGRRRCLTERW